MKDARPNLAQTLHSLDASLCQSAQPPRGLTCQIGKFKHLEAPDGRCAFDTSASGSLRMFSQACGSLKQSFQGLLHSPFFILHSASEGSF